MTVSRAPLRSMDSETEDKLFRLKDSQSLNLRGPQSKTLSAQTLSESDLYRIKENFGESIKDEAENKFQIINITKNMQNLNPHKDTSFDSATKDLDIKDEHILCFDNFIMVPFDPNSESDYEDYKSIVIDEEIMKTVSSFNCSVAKDEEEIRKTFKLLTEANKISTIPLSYRMIAVNGEFIGFIMPAILEKNEKGEITILDFGCLVKKKYRGSAALIACSTIAKQTFKVPSIKKIVVSALSDNYNPQAIFLRLGFKYIGQIKKGENESLINVFELTKEQVESGRELARIKNLKEFIDQMPKNLANENSMSDEFIRLFCLNGSSLT